MIVQLNIDGRDFFAKLECHQWYEHGLRDQLKMSSEKSSINVSIVNEYMAQLQPMTFDQTFRNCTLSEVRPGCDVERTYTLCAGDVVYNRLPLWSWDISGGLIKHFV